MSQKAALECIDAQNTANRQSAYARQDVERLRRKLAELDVDHRRDSRQLARECPRCFYLRSGGFAGQAFTNKRCKECDVVQTFPTTHTQDICEECADKLHLCRECGGDVDMETRTELARPRLRAGRAAWWAEQEVRATARRARIYKKEIP